MVQAIEETKYYALSYTIYDFRLSQHTPFAYTVSWIIIVT